MRVIDGIRDTLKNFEEDSEETAEEKEAAANAQKTLATIFDQLKALDMLPKEKADAKPEAPEKEVDAPDEEPVAADESSEDKEEEKADEDDENKDADISEDAS